MDDIFDSLIYIIITLVAFVISILGKKKKKPARPVNKTNDNPYKREEKPFLSNLEKILNEQLGVDQNLRNQFEEVNEIEQQPEVKIEKKEEILDTVPPEMLDDKADIPYSVEYDDTNEIFSKSITDEEIKTEAEDLNIESIDLEKAIIYSEIINRKEY